MDSLASGDAEAADGAKTPVLRPPATSRPDEPHLPFRWEYWRSVFGGMVWLLVSRPVVVPMVIGLVSGYLLIRFGDPSRFGSLGQGLMLGGLISGGLAWTQSVTKQLGDRRGLQIQLGLGSDLRNADLAKTDLSGAYLRDRRMSGARLSYARCYNADLSKADLRDARLTGGAFFGTSFTAADMTSLGGFQADFRNCRFNDANLQRASLCHADLRHADLTGADLRSADLRGCDLRDAKVTGARFSGAWYTRSTQWPDGDEFPGRNGNGTLGLVLKLESESGEIEPVIDLAEGNVPGDETVAGRPSAR